MTPPKKTWKERAKLLKREVYVLLLAYKDRRTPWYVRLVAACVLGYALSPIDLIPDFLPVLGYLDDLLLVPLGVLLTIKLIPPDVLAESRAQAETLLSQPKPVNWHGAMAVVLIWLLALALIGWLVVRWWQ